MINFPVGKGFVANVQVTFNEVCSVKIHSLFFFIFGLFLLWSVDAPAAGCRSFLAVPAGELPFWVDDSDIASLQHAVNRNLIYLGKLPAAQEVELCDSTFSVNHLIATQHTLLGAIERFHEPEKLQQFLISHFEICKAAGRKGDGNMLVTAYYEPTFAGSLKYDPPFIYPLYGVPADLVSRKDSTGSRQTGRMQDGELVPYWTRGEIEGKKLLAGNEIMYLADPIEAFILHVQGSGQVRLPDGKVRQVQFAGTNNHKYTSIGKVLVEEGVMSLEEVTLPRIIKYLHDHPEEQKRIFHKNARYVFFSIGEKQDHGPTGSMGQPLTAGRSIAIDRNCFPHGILGYLKTEKPIFDEFGAVTGWKTAGRFVASQDSGAAIKGPGRIDLFLGNSSDAEKAAGVMKQPGNLYFLILKSDNGP
ncbi:MAG: transglycosylase [Desulfovibrionaceae bacterium]|nr:transglycosylase [Desulfovibrionaceae bacterium]